MGIMEDIVKAARTGDYSNVSSLLNQALQILQHELSKGIIAPDGISKLAYSLETLTAMQQMQNWVAFADILEFEFIPFWKSLQK